MRPGPGLQADDLRWLETLPMRLPRDLSLELDRALVEVGAVVASDAAARAPRRSGRLAESLGVEVVAAGQVEVAAGVSYAAFVELGTARMRAQPFLEPALDATSARVDELLDQAADRALVRVVRG